VTGVRSAECGVRTCPNCGATVPPKAKVCPECGADEDTGWSEDAYAPNPDLPDDEFNYDEYVKREFDRKDPVPHGVSPFWWIIGILITGLMLYLCFR
jgi:hypothetical protein